MATEDVKWRMFKARPGTIDVGVEYETKVATLLCLRSLLQEVEDMWFASNVDGLGYFDDIILHTKPRDAEATTYLIQLKHKQNLKAIGRQEFMRGKGDFSLQKYFKSFSEIHESTKPEEQHPFKDLGSYGNVNFVLYTNRKMTECDFFEKADNVALGILNTSDSENIYRFNAEKFPNTGADVTSGNFYLLTNQMFEHLDSEIIMALKEFSLGDKEASKFERYVRDQMTGRLGGHYRLTKKDLLYKLTELALERYMLDLKPEAIRVDKTDIQDVWKNLINNKSIVFADSTASDFLTLYIANEIHLYFNAQVTSWTDELPSKPFYTEHADLSLHMLMQVGTHGRIRPLDIYKCLWRNHKLPLLLHVNNVDDYQSVINILKLSNYSYKVIVLKDFPVTKPKGVQCFETLQDLSEEDQITILSKEVYIQGRHGAVLKDFVNDSTLNRIKCTDILHILLKDFNIGNILTPLPPYFIQRSISKTMIKSDILSGHHDEIFVILNYATNFFNMEHKVLPFEDVDFSVPGDVSGIFSVERGLTSEQVKKLQSIKKPHHGLTIYDRNHFEWKWSCGSTATLNNFKTDFVYHLDREALNNVLDNVVIVSDAAGTGKSTLLDFVAQNAPINKWVLRVNLLQHSEYFQGGNSTIGAQKHLCYFYEASGTNDDLASCVFQKCVDTKNVLVLFDGFDEVPFKEEVTCVISCLHREGYQIWVTTRPYEKSILEKVLKTMSVSLAPLNYEEQKKFLMLYYKLINNQSSANKIQSFVEELLHNARESMMVEETSNILQIQLLAEVFLRDLKEFQNNETTFIFRNYDKLYLYENYMKIKLDIFLTKYGKHSSEIQPVFEKYQSLLALRLVFKLSETEEHIVQLHLKPMKKIMEETGFEDINSAVALDFAACWLAKNIDSPEEDIKELVRLLLKKRFDPNYEHFFIIFDRILCRSCPLHQAVMDKQEVKVAEIVNSFPDSVNKVDMAGRSALHIAGLYGYRYELPYNSMASGWYSKNSADARMVRITEHILKYTKGIQIDALGHSPLDYALATCSIEVAFKIYQLQRQPKVNIYISLDHKRDYLQYSYDIYPLLCNVLLPYFVLREFLLKRVRGDKILRLDRKMSILQLLESERGKVYSGYSKNHYTDLRFAVVLDSKTSVEKLLDDNAEINKPDLDGWTPFHYAVLHGRSEIVELLLNKGAQIDQPNKEKNTALHLAILENKFEIADLLLSRNARTDIVNDQGDTAVHMLGHKFDDSFHAKHKNICQFLLHNTEYVNMRNSLGETVLFAAVQNNSIYATREFLRRGAEINDQDRHGNTVLHMASLKGYSDVTRLLIENEAIVNLNNYDDDNTPLHLAAIKGHKNVCIILILAEVDINAANKNGDTPLHCAANGGHLDAVKSLAAKRANVQAENKHRDTPLHLAAQHGFSDTLNFLLRKNAYVDAANIDGNTPLHLISTRGYTDTAKQIIKGNANVNASNSRGDTPLHVACMHGHAEMATFLATIADDVLTVNKVNDTPLHIASQFGHVKIIDMLLHKGAYIDAENVEGNTPLHLTCIRGYMDAAKLLATMNAKVAKTNKNGDSPLHLAARYGHVDLVSCFLNEGVDIERRNVDGNTPLHLAAMHGCTAAANILTSMGATVDVPNNNGNTPLHLAVTEGYTDIAMLLVNSAADINTRDCEGNSAIHMVASAELLSLLLSMGADITLQNLNGDTALHVASTRGHIKIAELLTAKGADVNVGNGRADTALHLASDSGHADLTRLLLTSGANCNVQNQAGCSPLHLASLKGFKDVVELLYHSGADANLQDGRGQTSLQLATIAGHRDLIDLSFCRTDKSNSIDSNGDSLLHLAAAKGHLEIAALLVREIDANMQNNSGMTPLHCASLHGHVKVAHLLIDAGADIDARDQNGDTALHFALSNGSTDILNLLLDSTFDVDVKNSKKNTLLHLAAMKGNTELANLLIDNGASINAVNQSNDTPLHFAVAENHADVVSFLLSKGADLDVVNDDEETPLYLAAETGNREVLKMLLKDYRFPADHILAENCKLHLAILQGEIEKIKDIIASDSTDLVAVDKANRSALHILASHGVVHPVATFYTESYGSLPEVKDIMADFAEQILERIGDDFYYDDILGRNPLDYAIASNALAVAEKICTKLPNLSLNLHIEDKRVYFAYCGFFGYQNLFKTLVKYFASRDILCDYVNPSLDSYVVDDCENAIYVLSEGDPDDIKMFDATMQRIQNYTKVLGAERVLDLFQSEDGHYTDLRFAAIFGTAENIVSLLKERNVNCHDADQNTPLHYCAMYPNDQCKGNMKLLLSSGAEINSAGKYGNTALHWAIKNSLKQAVVLLLQSGANLDNTNDFGESPLHAAAKSGCEEITELLLKAGAAISRDDYGRTPLHYAANKNYSQVLKLLLDKDTMINEQDTAENTALIYAIKGVHTQSVELLLQKADLSMRDFHGKTALHWAASLDALKVVEWLLEKGVEINAADGMGNTPLHCAVRTHNNELVNLLLTRGADANALNNLKQNPLHLACSTHHLSEDEDDCSRHEQQHLFEPDKQIENIKLVLNKDSVKVKDCFGKTPLDYAAEMCGAIKRYIRDNSEDCEEYRNLTKYYDNFISMVSSV